MKRTTGKKLSALLAVILATVLLAGSFTLAEEAGAPPAQEQIQATPPAAPGPESTVEGSTAPEPTATPITEPTAELPAEPTAGPVTEPAPAPITEPTAELPAEPTAGPAAEPTPAPITEPTAELPAEPTAGPAAEPTPAPITEPTAELPVEPTAGPVTEPTPAPITEPTAELPVEPTAGPTMEPEAEMGFQDEGFTDFLLLAQAPAVTTTVLTVSFPGVMVDSVDVTPAGGATLRQEWKSNAAVFSIPVGAYTVKVRKGAMVYEQPIDCTLETQTLAVPLTTLTVDFPGVSTNRVSVMLDGKEVMANEWKTDSTAFTVFEGKTYGIMVKRGTMVYSGSIACAGDSAALAVPLTKATVNFQGVSTDRVSIMLDGSEVIANEWKSNSTGFTLFAGKTYSVVLKRGTMATEGILTCDGPTATLDVPTTALAVNFPGISADRVSVIQDGKEVIANEWKSNSTVFTVFRGQTYTVALKRGNMTYDTTVACDGPTAAVDVLTTTLTVNFPGVSADRISVILDGKEVIVNEWKSNSTAFTVFRGKTYVVTVKRGAMVYSGEVVCSGETAVLDVPLTTLNVHFPNVSTQRVSVLVNGSEVLANEWKSGSTVFTVFKGQTYVLAAKNGTMIHQSAPLLCDEDTETYNIPICRVTVLFDGISARQATLSFGGSVVLKNEWQAGSTVFYAFQDNPYAVRVQVGDKEYAYDPVDLRANEVVLGQASAAIRFPGVASVTQVQLKDKAGKTYSKGYVSNEAAFQVPNGLYEIKLVKGGMTYTAANVPLVGNTVYDVPLTTLTVNFPNVASVTNTAVSVGGAGVVSNGYQSNQTVFTLFRGIQYDLKLHKGGMVHEGSIVCDEDTETYNVPLSTLTVNFPGVASVTTTAVSVGGNGVTSNGYQNNQTTFTLFAGITYDLKLQKGGMIHVGSILCDEAVETYDVPLTTLTVQFPGVASVTTTAVSVGGSGVTANGYQNNQTVFTLFAGITYDLKLQKGGMIHEGSILCDDAVETYDVPLTTLTVNFAGVANVTTTAVSVGGNGVISNGYQNNQTTFTLFRNVSYELMLQKGTMIHLGSIACDEPAETYNVPVCHVKVLFDGQSATNVSILFGGSAVYSNGYPKNSTDFFVFQDHPYAVRVTIGGKDYWYNQVDCRANEVTLGNAGITVRYPGLLSVNRVLLKNSKGASFYKDWTSNEATLNVPNGVYDITVTKGGMVYAAKGVLLIGDMIHDIPMTAVTVDFTGVKSVDRTLISVGTATVSYSDWKNDSATFVLFRNQTYNVKVQKGGMIHTGAISCVADTAVYAVPVVPLRVDFSGVKSVDRTQISVGTANVIYSDWQSDSASFLLFGNQTYTLKVQKGGMVYTAPVTLGTEAVTHPVPLTTLTVSFPGIKSVDRTQISVGTANVIYSDWQNDSATFVLFRGLTYHVKVQKGGMIHTGTISCQADTAVYAVPVVPLKVDFSGVKSVDRTQISVGTANVIYSDWQNDSASFLLLGNQTYNLKVQKGGMIYTAQVTLGTEALTHLVPLTTLTVNFPGVKSVDRTLISVGTANVTYSDWQNDKAVFVLFRNQAYNVKVQKGGMIHTASISLRNESESYHVPLTTLTVDFSGVKSVDRTQISVGSATVIYSDWQSDKAVFVLIRGITYEVRVQKGSYTHAGKILCDGPTETYRVPSGALTGQASPLGAGSSGSSSSGSSFENWWKTNRRPGWDKKWVDRNRDWLEWSFHCFKGRDWNLEFDRLFRCGSR